MKIKKDDNVIVIAGKYKGKTGTVSKTYPSLHKVIVSDVNVVKKHSRAGADGAGGIISKELPIHVSNIALIDVSDNRGCRVGYVNNADGDKQRVSRRTKKVID